MVCFDLLQQPRKALLEQLARVLPTDSDSLPDQLILANTCDRQGAHLAAKLADFGHRVICTAGQADVRATLTCLVAKIQKFCNTKTQNPHHVKVALGMVPKIFHTIFALKKSFIKKNSKKSIIHGNCMLLCQL